MLSKTASTCVDPFAMIMYMHPCASGNNLACKPHWRFFCYVFVIGCYESDDEITMVSMVSGILFYILLSYR